MKSKLSVSTIILLLGIIACQESANKSYPEPAQSLSGYIDSPYLVPDGSALYFLHSIASPRDMVTANPFAKPQANYLPGHQAQNGEYWWNTDLYVVYRTKDGGWSKPENLGEEINTKHLECCVWVDNTQSTLVFTREAVNDDPSISGTFITFRDNKENTWGTPKKFPGKLGNYAESTFSDFHLTTNNNIYFWGSNSGNADLFWAKNLGPFQWAQPEPFPSFINTPAEETQPWVNDDETIMYFNRRHADGETELLFTTRLGISTEWEQPTRVELLGFEDETGSRIWGEPSFQEDGNMHFVRFNMQVKNWRVELMKANKNKDGGYGPVEMLEIEYE